MEKLDIRVAKIIEVDKIVINKGLKDNINQHMEFLVYEDGDEILDPITNKSLGLLENPKGMFKALHIQESMSILLSKTNRPNKLAIGLATMFTDVDSERDLLRSIKIGDKVKITNQI